MMDEQEEERSGRSEEDFVFSNPQFPLTFPSSRLPVELRNEPKGRG
jgi:hypothetical protein